MNYDQTHHDPYFHFNIFWIPEVLDTKQLFEQSFHTVNGGT